MAKKKTPPARAVRVWYSKTVRLTESHVGMVEKMQEAMGSNFGEFIRYLILQEWKGWRPAPPQK